jgi:DNA polymerase III epsilon subunit-like protein
MLILFLDTETNGLPKNRYASYTMTDAWPTLVQVAWQVMDFSVPTKPVPIYSSSFLVQPEPGQIWNEESAAIHGFTEAQARHGMPAVAVLRSLLNDAAECDIIVAHNVGFDKPVLLAATLRAGLSPRWWPKQEICTMLASKDVCKIPSSWKWAKATDPYKWPKLIELWQTLFPTSALPTNLHDARQDVAVLVTCVQELVRRGLLVLPDVPRRCDRFTDFFRRVLYTLVP